ncbi:MAG: cadmium-translocating P-type ATPase [Acidobacteria bacterium SCN 69-37]|nr:MAG: cadmium-translocating P-type ATPase [Acidobacteria bacterium SCN 69-37]
MRRREAARIGLVAVLTLLYWRGWLPFPLLVLTLATGLYPLAKAGLLELWHERKIGTELFVTVATLIAFIGGEYVAAAVLMTIILIAEYIADFNTDRARASIKALIGATPRTATVRTPDGEQTVPIDSLAAGAVVLVRAGEKIPVDGTVLAGMGAVNESSITGESLPVEKSPSTSVLAGTIVETGALDVRTEKVGADTLFARIVKLVEQAESEAAPVQKLADRVAAWLLPLVLVFLIGVFVVTRDVRKIVALLIFTSPAELGLATPMVMIAAIARAARLGILVKGGLYLEQLAKADAFVFDKTGTLTYGTPVVVEVVAHDAAFTDDQLLALAAAADQRSAHPLARAVVEAARERGLQISGAHDFRTIHGRGVIAIVDAREVMVGNDALLEEHAVKSLDIGFQYPGTSVRIAVKGQLAGSVHFADQPKVGTADALQALRQSGVKRLVMLTGDNLESARQVADSVGIEDVRARLLPEEKVGAVEDLRRQGFIVAMVGDGVNDAPALARADVGIAMGARGTQAAIEAADIALMADDLAKIATARLLARRAYRTIQENLIVGVGVVHVLGIIAALQGWIGPIQAALLHLGPDVLVFLNSVKLLRVRLEGAQ